MWIKKSLFPLFQLVILGQKLHLRKLKLCICQPKCTEQMSNVTKLQNSEQSRQNAEDRAKRLLVIEEARAKREQEMYVKK